MYETGTTAQIAAEMRRYKLTVLGLCETRWTRLGQIRLATGETFIYSGHGEEDAPYTEGVASKHMSVVEGSWVRRVQRQKQRSAVPFEPLTYVYDLNGFQFEPRYEETGSRRTENIAWLAVVLLVEDDVDAAPKFDAERSGWASSELCWTS
ncbi:hypothetical protein LSAT2_032843 [Lamellibrachia satsuma]|nr:hypothetical protein LSAT2_032843 [Lamellibrachia satsuma]